MTLHAYITPSGKVHVGRRLESYSPHYVVLYCTGRAQSRSYAVDDRVTCKACVARAARDGLDISDPIRIAAEVR